MLPVLLALAGMGLKIGGDVLGAQAQNKAAKQNAIDARLAETMQLNDVNARSAQEQLAAGQQIDQVQRQATTVAASAVTSAGEAGVEGNSVNALMQSVSAESSRIAGTIQLNQKLAQQQLDREKLGIAAQADSRVNAVPGANPWATALKIGGDVIGTAGQLYGMRAPSSNKISQGKP